MSEGELYRKIREKTNPFLKYQKHIEKHLNESLKPELEKHHAEIKLISDTADMLLPMSFYEEVLDEAKQDYPVFGINDIDTTLRIDHALEKFRIQESNATWEWFLKWFGEPEGETEK